jgi:hypothetical protein
MNFHQIISKRILWIVGIWAGSQTVFFPLFGIRWGGDSGRYVEAARNILSGVPLIREQWYYLSYEWMLVPIFSLGGGLMAVVFTQCVLSLIGAFFLYGMGKNMFSQTAGLAAAIAYLIHPSIQRWNYYVLTESLATNALIAVIGLALFCRKSKWANTALLPAALVLALVRPETLLFLLPVSLFLLEICFSWSSFSGAFLMVIVLSLGWIRTGSSEAFGLLLHWEKGTYIWGYPGIGGPKRAIVGAEGSVGASIVQLLWADLLWGMKVMGLRVYYFLFPIRPYFSGLHNWAALGSSLVVYALALWGSLSTKSRELKLIGGILLVQMGLVAITWSDWDSRWLDRVTPLLILLAAGGGEALWKSFGIKWYKPPSYERNCFYKETE